MSAHGWFTASPEVRYCAALALLQTATKPKHGGPLLQYIGFVQSRTAVLKKSIFDTLMGLLTLRKRHHETLDIR